MVRGAWCVFGADREFVGVVDCLAAFEGEFQFHGGLAFEADLLAQADERGNSVKEAPYAGGPRRIEAARQHGLERAQVSGEKACTGARPVMAKAASPNIS